MQRLTNVLWSNDDRVSLVRCGVLLLSNLPFHLRQSINLATRSFTPAARERKHLKKLLMSFRLKIWHYVCAAPHRAHECLLLSIYFISTLYILFFISFLISFLINYIFQYIVSGSDEMNLRLWKARRSEKLGILKDRERVSLQYAEKLKQKYGQHPQVIIFELHKNAPLNHKSNLKT